MKRLLLTLALLFAPLVASAQTVGPVPGPWAPFVISGGTNSTTAVARSGYKPFLDDFCPPGGCAGDYSLAIARAAAHSPTGLIWLTEKAYPFTVPQVIPHTIFQGNNASSSTLNFTTTVAPYAALAFDTNGSLPITSISYASTGVVSVHTGAEIGFSTGAVFTMAGIGGTGSFAQLNTTANVVVTDGQDFTYTIAPNLTLTANLYTGSTVTGFSAIAYNSTTGLVTATLTTTSGLTSNLTYNITGVGGTGSFAALNTNAPISLIAGGTQFTYVVSPGLTMAPTTSGSTAIAQTTAMATPAGITNGSSPGYGLRDVVVENGTSTAYPLGGAVSGIQFGSIFAANFQNAGYAPTFENSKVQFFGTDISNGYGTWGWNFTNDVITQATNLLQWGNYTNSGENIHLNNVTFADCKTSSTTWNTTTCINIVGAGNFDIEGGQRDNAEMTVNSSAVVVTSNGVHYEWPSFSTQARGATPFIFANTGTIIDNNGYYLLSGSGDGPIAQCFIGTLTVNNPTIVNSTGAQVPYLIYVNGQGCVAKETGVINGTTLANGAPSIQSVFFNQNGARADSGSVGVNANIGISPHNDPLGAFSYGNRDQWFNPAATQVMVNLDLGSQALSAAPWVGYCNNGNTTKGNPGAVVNPINLTSDVTSLLVTSGTAAGCAGSYFGVYQLPSQPLVPGPYTTAVYVKSSASTIPFNVAPTQNYQQAISSATYSGTNLAIVVPANVTGAAPFSSLAVGQYVNVSGLTGTGSVATLNSVWPIASTSTSPNTINLTVPASLTLTINSAVGAVVQATPYVINSCTYATATGSTVCQMPAPTPDLQIGSNITIYGLSGTGGFASLSGTTASLTAVSLNSVTGLDTVTFTAGTGFGTSAITAGSYVLNYQVATTIWQRFWGTSTYVAGQVATPYIGQITIGNTAVSGSSNLLYIWGASTNPGYGPIPYVATTTASYAPPVSLGPTSMQAASIGSANDNVSYVNRGYPLYAGSSPTASSGTPVTGSTVASGSVTDGTSITSETITFPAGYFTTVAPNCTFTDSTAAVNVTSYTVSTTAITATLAANTNNVLRWLCAGGY